MDFFKNLRKSQFRLWKKGVLELSRAARIKPRQIERSGFFLLDTNGSLRKVKKFNGMFPTKKKIQESQNEFDPGTLNPTTGHIGLTSCLNIESDYSFRCNVSHFIIVESVHFITLSIYTERKEKNDEINFTMFSKYKCFFQLKQFIHVVYV